MSIASAYDYCWFFEKKLGRGEKNTKVERIRYLWRRSRGTLTFFSERSRMDGKEPLQEHISVWENLLYNIYFLLIKFSRISYKGIHLCPFLLFFQILMKYLKINALYKWTPLSRQFFRHGSTSLFFVKGERFYNYFYVTIFLGKNSNFPLLNLTTSSKNWGSLQEKKSTKAIKQNPSFKNFH